MKRWTKILLALVGLVVLGVASIPFFVNANTFRPIIESQLTTTFGRSVKLGDLSLALGAFLWQPRSPKILLSPTIPTLMPPRF